MVSVDCLLERPTSPLWGSHSFAGFYTLMPLETCALPGHRKRQNLLLVSRRQDVHFGLACRHGHALSLAGEATQHVQRAIYADRFAKRMKQHAAARKKAEAKERRQQQAGGRVHPFASDAPMISFSAAKAGAAGHGSAPRAAPSLPTTLEEGAPGSPGAFDPVQMSAVPAHTAPEPMVVRRHNAAGSNGVGGGFEDRHLGTPSDTPDEPEPASERLP
eukprot:444742-Pelagomonas_calceolata.AAC.2